ncbi:MAG: UDP-glucose 4-epimerase GalE, partial [Sphingomonadales bacterium]|nr:UDP-glucose 4-epimerase GalE [Sphingomonadales bacterium]
LDAVERVSGKTLERRIEGRRAGDPAALVADNARILATIDWSPRYDDLDAIVRDALGWEEELARRGVN